MENTTKEVIIVINDIIKTNLADDDIKGDNVFKIIKEYAQGGSKEITLNFEGIELVNTAFLNNAIGKLFDKNSFNLSKCNVLVRGMDETMIELLTEAIRVARQKYLRI